MGIASLILGIVSLVIGFIPLCGSIALFPAIVGLILGIIDVAKKSKEGEKKGQGVAGLIMSTIAIFTIIFWVFVFSVGDTNTSTLTPGDSSKPSESGSSSIYNVGEIYQDGSIAIKFVSVDDNFKGYSKYADVKSGYKVVKAQFEFENLSSSDTVVSAYDFDCYADGYDCEDFWSTDDSGFSATLSAGKKTKGNVYFEVPKDASEITLEYGLNFWTSDRVKFKVK